MHALRSRLVLVAALLGAATAQSPAPDVAAVQRSLIEVRVSGPAQLMQLLALDLDLAGCRTPLPGQRRIEVIGRPGDLALLRQAGMKCRVVVPDL
ncbi:MAG: hypothetical protein KAI24_24015, partial [Planctomycetes bacterium]|nr:hypothetical protein [Planctomycetota bacterium]